MPLKKVLDPVAASLVDAADYITEVPENILVGT